MNAALRLVHDGSQVGTQLCTQPWRQRPYRETLALGGQRRVTLRPAHHSDAQALQDFYSALSPRSRLMRFHGAVNRLPDTVLRRFTHQVAHQHVALLATSGTAAGLPLLVGEARYVVDTTAAHSAEFAVAVADDWQGLGLGRAMIQRLCIHAQAEGLRSLHSVVMAGNEGMLGLLHQLGAELYADATEVQATLRL